MESFRDLLGRLAKRFPSRDAFAKAIGIDNSRLSRALNAGDFPFNIENCLKLAKVSGESPTDILRAAGKADIADLIELLYGRESEFTAEEKDMIAAYRSTTPRAQHAIRLLLNDLIPEKARTAKKKTA